MKIKPCQNPYYLAPSDNIITTYTFNYSIKLKHEFTTRCAIFVYGAIEYITFWCDSNGILKQQHENLPAVTYRRPHNNQYIWIYFNVENNIPIPCSSRVSEYIHYWNAYVTHYDIKNRLPNGQFHNGVPEWYRPIYDEQTRYAKTQKIYQQSFFTFCSSAIIGMLGWGVGKLLRNFFK